MADSPRDRREFVPFSEAAAILGVSSKTLRKLTDSGLLPWYEFEGWHRIRKRDLEEFCARHRMTGRQRHAPKRATGGPTNGDAAPPAG